MELPSLPSFYLSAPTSPVGCSSQDLRFYSTRSSPLEQVGYQNTDDDEFQFGTSQRLAHEWDHEEQYYRLPARANSFSTMAFADELFSDGQVLPLKLPPRLQRSFPTSPRSLSSHIKNPLWNDDFDPFMIALEKVSEETCRRMSVQRRSRSYSPFRAPSIISRSVNWDQEQTQHRKPGRDLEAKELKITEMMERKGSMYSRWVRSQTMIKNQSPTARTMMKRLWRARRVRDTNFSHNNSVKPMKKPSQPISCTESKMQKVKSVLLRYASLKKEPPETNEKREIMTISKISYFKRLSLSFKTYMRKKELIESKRAIVKHDTKPLRCFGYAPRSARMMQALRIL